MKQGAYFKGDTDVIVLCTMFLVSSSVNVSSFHITCLDTFWTDLVLCKALDGPRSHNSVS